MSGHDSYRLGHHDASAGLLAPDPYSLGFRGLGLRDTLKPNFPQVQGFAPLSVGVLGLTSCALKPELERLS